jgi:hypothetical protein
MTDADKGRTLPKPANDTTYPVDAPKVSSNADLRVAEDEEQIDAAMSPTGLDIANDHADETPVNRSQDAPEKEADEQFTPTE